MAMIELATSGLPITIDEATYKLAFHGGLSAAGSSAKTAGQLKGLLYAPEGVDEDEPCYEAYRDVAFPADRARFQALGLRYDLTVIQPGTLQGECKKTSGHYHGPIAGQPLTYPEVYQVCLGRAVYILQKVSNFDQENEEPLIEDVQAVFVEAGQAILIPPFYGHGSINAGDGPLVFCNLAAVACPLFYQPVQKKHGLSVYALKEEGRVHFIPNPHYKNVPPVRVTQPRDNPALGVTSGQALYATFIEAPWKFDFLLNPGRYQDAFNEMLNER